MFGKLKERLKNFLKKEEEVEEKEITPAEDSSPDVSKEKSNASKKKEVKKKKAIVKRDDSLKEDASKEPVEKDNKKLELVQEETSEQDNDESVVEKRSFFNRFTKKITHDSFSNQWEELEMILLQANVAYPAVEHIRESLENELVGKSVKDVDVKFELRRAVESLFSENKDFFSEVKSSLSDKRPFVLLCAGINGTGKTTTIAKLAHTLKKSGLSVCLAAADTFRAASIEQISEHATRLGVPLIKKEYGSDPASVAFDAVSYARKNNVDVVLIDTAGRMQNSDTLMKEIQKIVRVVNPDMKLFVGESITGNDCINQAQAFDEAINLTGIILSKADVDEQGGTALSISFVTRKPILFLGVGQSYDDLEPFDKSMILEKLGL